MSDVNSNHFCSRGGGGTFEEEKPTHTDFFFCNISSPTSQLVGCLQTQLTCQFNKKKILFNFLEKFLGKNC